MVWLPIAKAIKKGEDMRKVKILIVLFTTMLFLCSAAQAAKESQSDTKIGLINIQKVLAESKAGKEAKAVFEKELEGRRATLQAKEKEVRAMETELRTGAAKLKSDVKKSKEENLAAETKELRRLGQDMEDELKKKDAELTSKILKDVFGITRKMGEEKRYTLIMQAGPQVIYIDKTIDITDEVMKRYDEQYARR